MPLSWNEIKTRAAAFVGEGRKKAEREYKVPLGKNETTLFGDMPESGQKGYIDLFAVGFNTQEPAYAGELQGGEVHLWKGKILIEMKSPGHDLQKAYEQAKTYANALPAKDFPSGILVSDFNQFVYRPSNNIVK